MKDKQDYIAIVGSGIVFPDSFTKEAYWQNILKKNSCISIAPIERWDYRDFYSENRECEDKGYSALGGYIKGFEFDGSQFGIDKNDASFDMHEMEQWLLTAFDECVRDVKKNSKSNRVKVIIGATGVTSPAVEMLLSRQMQDDFDSLGLSAPQGQISIKELTDVAQKIEHRGVKRDKIIDWTLLNCVKNAVKKIGLPEEDTFLIDAACSSSLFSVEIGINYLNDGSADVVYCGGLSRWSEIGQVLFSKLSGLSSEGLFSFDERASGTVFGDGAGVIALKKLSKALEDGDEIQGIIRGIGIASDGKGKAIYAPNSKGQVLAIERAYQTSNIDKSTIQYVEAHATGTPLGDYTEFSSLVESFKEVEQGEISLGSVKSLHGHLGWAAGVASITKILLSMKNSTMPPQTNFEKPNPKISLDSSPFFIQTEPSPWKANRNNVPRRAAINGFGFGGTNGHVILEEYLESYHKCKADDESVREKKEIVLIDIGAVFPGVQDYSELKEKMTDNSGLNIDDVFGASYKVPNISFRILPKTARVTDVAYFQLLDATRQIITNHKEVFDSYKNETGVIIGNMDALDKSVGCYQRIRFDNLNKNIDQLDESAAENLRSGLKTWRTEICSKLPASTEDSFPGIMPNVLSGRICNYYDFQGINYCIDHGFSSFSTGIELACKSLVAGTSKIILAGAVNSANQSSMVSMISDKYGSDFGQKQGAAMLMLMERSFAQELQLPVLGTLNINEKNHAYARSQSPDWMGLSGGLDLIKSVIFKNEAIIKPSDETKVSISYTPFEKEAKEGAEDNVVSRYKCKMVLNEIQNPVESPEKWGKETLIVTQSPDVYDRLSVKFNSCTLLFVDLLSKTHGLNDQRGHVHRFSGDTEVYKGISLGNIKRIVSYISFDDGFERENYGVISGFWSFLYGLYQNNYSEIQKQKISMIHILADSLSGNNPVHPGSGLFTGFSAALSMELQDNKVVSILYDGTDIQNIESLVANEEQLSDKEVQYRNNKRYIPGVFKEDIKGKKISLNNKRVVLAVGGARGITFESVNALSQEENPVIICIGRTSLQNDLIDESYEFRDFMIDRKAEFPERSVKEIKEEFQRLQNIINVKRNMAVLKERNTLSEYVACDITSEEDVEKTMAYIYEKYDKIDVIVYGAGITGKPGILSNSDTPLNALKVLQVKIDGLTNLIKYGKKTVAERIFIFGSMASKGLDGMISYGSVNDFMNKFTDYFNYWQQDMRFTCINWCGWGDIGIVKDSGLADTMKERGYTLLSNEEGRDMWLNEYCSDSDGSVYIMGKRERELFSVSKEKSSVHKRHFIDNVTVSSKNKIVITRDVNTERDSYLKGHTAGGECVIPGTFSLEIAAEAALELIPDSKVAKMSDIVFESYMKVFEGRNLPLKITAELTGKEGAESVIKVDVTSDFISPKGIVLKRDRQHFSCNVHVKDSLSELKDFSDIPDTLAGSESLLFDPYTQDDAFIKLSGIFDTLHSIEFNGNLSSSVYDNKLTDKDTDFHRFIVPSLLLDGTLRTAAMRVTDGKFLPLYVPLKIKEISFGGELNDWEIKSDKTLSLRILSKMTEDNNQLSADFKVINNRDELFLTMSGLSVEHVGYMNTDTKDFISNDDFLKIQKSEFCRFHPVLVPGTSYKNGNEFKPQTLITNDLKAVSECRNFKSLHERFLLGGDIPETERSLGWLQLDDAVVSQRGAGKESGSCVIVLNFSELQKEINTDFLEVLYKWIRSRIESLSEIVFIALGAMDSFSSNHPSLGAVTGLIKTVGLELKEAQGAIVITDQIELDNGLMEYSQGCIKELNSVFLPAFYYNKIPYQWRLKQAGDKLSLDKNRIDDSSVVLISGGSRGIGFEIAKKILKESSARVILLGRTRVDDYVEDIRTYTTSEGAFNKSQFISDKKSSTELNMKDILSEAQRVQDAALIYYNFKNLKSDSVSYYPCDISDAQRVQSVFNEVYNKFKKIDIIVHSAGIEKSKSIVKKEWDEFSYVFNVKIQGYKNIINSISDPRPSLICNFASINSFFGSDGQADYNSANELYNSIGAYSNRFGGMEHKTFGWTAWDDVGMVATRSEIADILKKRGYNFLPAETGTQLFFDEMNSCTVPNSQVLVVAKEDLALWSSQNRIYNTCDYISIPDAESVIIEESDKKVKVCHSYKSNDLKYLRNHLVDGVPAFPGACEYMMAYSLLQAKFPEFYLRSFNQVEFKSFLKIPENTPFDIYVTAEVERIDTDRIYGTVKIMKDFYHKSGILLVKEKLYWQSGFVMGTKGIEPEQVLINSDGVHGDVTHYREGSTIYYSDSMRTLKKKIIREDGSSYGVIENSVQEIFGGTPLPMALIDGLGLTINMAHNGDNQCFVSPKVESVKYSSDFFKLSSEDYRSKVFISQAEKPIDLNTKEKGRSLWLVPRVVLSDENGHKLIEVNNVTLVDC